MSPVAYAIIRYRIPDFDRLLHKQVAYGVMTSAVVAVYFSLLAALSALLGERLPADDPLVISLALFAMVLLFNPLRAAAQALVDRLFYRHRADYAQALGAFARELTTTIELGLVLKRLVGRLEATLLPDRAHVYLFDEDSGAYLAHAANGLADAPAFSPDGLLVSRLYYAEHPLSFTPDGADGTAVAGDWRTLADLRLIVLAPLRAERRLTGWLALGPKRSGEPYTEDDLEYVATLASQSALAVENAPLYVNLRRNYQRTVEMKNLLDDTFASIASGVVTIDMDGTLTAVANGSSRAMSTQSRNVVFSPK